MTTILVAGDTCPVGRNELFFRRGDVKALLGDFLPECEAADLVIANLECPLIEKESPIKKCGPNLGAPVDCVNGLKAMGIDIVGLANNHIMDHGPQGLRTTMRTLEENGIAHVGAGENLEAARKIVIHKVQSVRIGILALAEHEFGIASIDGPGANPLDIIDAVRNINACRASFDRLIVLLHGGNEHYQYPRPRLMDTCRFLVEQGANAVICQHSHCAGCMETYQGAPIVYGQGNFLFDRSGKHAAWYEGVLVCLTIDRCGHSKADLIPFRQSAPGLGARKMAQKEREVFLKDFNSRSKGIQEQGFVQEQWQTFCRERKRYYLHGLHGKPGLLRRLAGKLDLLHYLDSREVQRRRLNLIRCESHREALQTLLAMEVNR